MLDNHCPISNAAVAKDSGRYIVSQPWHSGCKPRHGMEMTLFIFMNGPWKNLVGRGLTILVLQDFSVFNTIASLNTIPALDRCEGWELRVNVRVVLFPCEWKC